MKSKKILRLIGVATTYKRRPSEMLGIEDAYTAYCLDEACAFIVQKLKDGEEIIEKTHYSSFSQLYKNYGYDVKGG